MNHYVLDARTLTSFSYGMWSSESLPPPSFSSFDRDVWQSGNAMRSTGSLFRSTTVHASSGTTKGCLNGKWFDRCADTDPVVLLAGSLMPKDVARTTPFGGEQGAKGGGTVQRWHGKN